jgi:peptidoglycan/xylan/chitin deacetylase (PgdA/CDA1 family)
MRIPGVKQTKTFSRWIKARLLGGALILGYHRVADVTRDEYEVCVASEHFAEQMEALNKFAHPIPLSELVACLQEGSVRPKSVAVTFDDGYADTLYEAKPVLERYEIPATVFVCTGSVGNEFWWDELERLVMSSNAEPDALCMEMRGNHIPWHLPDISLRMGTESRRRFCHALYNYLLGLDVEDRNQAMDSIRRWSGVPSIEVTARSMNHDELLQLVEGGLVELGAHTRHHPMLPRLTLARQREEIVASKRDLEALLGKRVEGFAYPNGSATDDARRIVREAGLVFACTSLHDVVRPTSDLFGLTRFWQKDVDGEEFLGGLRLWLKGDWS